jgi:TPR repeat protein
LLPALPRSDGFFGCTFYQACLADTQAKRAPTDQQAFSLYQKETSLYHDILRVDANWVDVLLNLSFMYYAGYGVKQNQDRAEQLLRKAAVQGNASAMLNLGMWTVKKSPDPEKARSLCKFAIGSGSPVLVYEPKEKGDRDVKHAIVWWEQAAEMGCAAAQYHLGQVYTWDSIVTDEKKGLMWLRLSSAQEFSHAMFELGLDCERANDTVEAAAWFKALAFASAPITPDLVISLVCH